MQAFPMTYSTCKEIILLNVQKAYTIFMGYLGLQFLNKKKNTKKLYLQNLLSRMSSF